MPKKRGRFVRSAHQQGFTLVNIAAIVVGSAVSLGVVKTGLNVVSNQHHESLYQSLQSIESQYWAFHDAAGRWPGDCNRDQVIGYHPENTIAPVDQAGPALVEVQCQNEYQSENFAAIAQDFERKDLPVTNSLYVMLGNNISVRAGHGVVKGSSYNVLVLYGVPSETAQWLDKEVDGVVSGQLGRVRRWDHGDHGGPWPRDADDSTTVAYYFDKSAPL